MASRTTASGWIGMLALLSCALLQGQEADTTENPEPTYDLAAHASEYLHDAFGPRAVLTAAASGLASYGVKGATGWEIDNGEYGDRVAANLVRNSVAQSIEFGTAAFFEQDEKFHTSEERGFRRRARAAQYRTLFVPGREGDELAVPRLAAALGTPWAMREWHPGLTASPSPWTQTAFLFRRYLARSFWAEFRPEITNAFRKALRRTLPGD